MKTLTDTTGLGILPLRWNSFTQTAGANYAAISASFTPLKVAVILSGSTLYPAITYRFSITSGVVPAWVQPGVSVSVAASVTVSSVSHDLSGSYTVAAVAPNGKSFDVKGRGQYNATLAATNLDSGSGTVTTPLVNLIMQAQKAMLKASAGVVIIAPAVDVDGTAPYSITLDGTAEYEVTAQPGSKFDLADWKMKYTGSGTLSVRFI